MGWWLIIPAALGLYVLLDGQRRGTGSPFAWALGTFLLAVVVLPAYLAYRPLLPNEVREGGKAWNVLRGFALVWTGAMILVGLIYFVSLSNAAALQLGPWGMASWAIGGVLGIGTLLLLWFVPLIAALILGIFVKQTSVIERG